MHKRDVFVADLRKLAKSKGLKLVFKKGKRAGKGSHGRVVLSNGVFTTIPDRAIDPKTAAKIKKGLGL